MRPLIVGASGFVGATLLDEFGAGARGTYHQRWVDGLLPLDMRDRAAVDRCIAETQAEAVLLPAAQPHVDWCEDHADESHAINVIGPTNVARASAAADIPLVFFSTDYVFDGTAGPYGEDAPTNPLSVYGKHKLAAEEAVLAANAQALVVRLCGVFGHETQGKNFVMATLARARRGEPTRVPVDQLGTPTYAADLAGAVRRELAAGTRGILHLSGADYLDRAAFGRLIAEVFGFDPGLIEERTTAQLNQNAARPLRGGVRSQRAAALPGARSGLQRLRAILGSEWPAHA